MQAAVGDRILMRARRVGEHDRRAEFLAVEGEEGAPSTWFVGTTTATRGCSFPVLTLSSSTCPPRGSHLTSEQRSTLDGEVSIDVAPGTQPGVFERVKGMGLPHPNGKGRGDLCVGIAICSPQELTDRQGELWEQLREDVSRRD